MCNMYDDFIQTVVHMVIYVYHRFVEAIDCFLLCLICQYKIGPTAFVHQPLWTKHTGHKHL